MGVEELKLIAEILGGLESAGLTGFLFWLGTKFFVSLVQVGAVILFIWLCYKLASKYLVNEKYADHFKTLASTIGEDIYGSPTDKELSDAVATAVELREQKAKFKEKEESLTLRFGSLTKDYEKLYEAWSDKKELVETQQKMLDELKERSAHGD